MANMTDGNTNLRTQNSALSEEHVRSRAFTERYRSPQSLEEVSWKARQQAKIPAEEPQKTVSQFANIGSGATDQMMQQVPKPAQKQLSYQTSQNLQREWENLKDMSQQQYQKAVPDFRFLAEAEQSFPQRGAMSQPEIMDPTISQDHTAGKEERERALLSTASSTIADNGYASQSNSEARLLTPGPKTFYYTEEAIRRSQESAASSSSQQLSSTEARPLKKRKTQRTLANDERSWAKTGLEDPPLFAAQPGKDEASRKDGVIEGTDTQRTHPGSARHHSEDTMPNQRLHAERSLETRNVSGTEQLTAGPSSKVGFFRNDRSIDIHVKDTASIDARDDWCEDSVHQQELQLLRSENARLRDENTRLGDLVRQTKRQVFAALPSRWIFLHRLGSDLYFDVPHWTTVDQGHWSMECLKPVSNAEIFLERQKRTGVAFAVVCEYENNTSSSDHANRENQHYGMANQEPIYPTHTSIQFLCKVLDNAWGQLLEQDKMMNHHCRFSCAFERFCGTLTHELRCFHEIETFLYHFQFQIRQNIRQMDDCAGKKQLTLLVDFVLDRFRAEYDGARRLFDNGLVIEGYVKYLFAPEAILLARERQQDLGYVQRSFVRTVQGQTLTVEATSWVLDDDGTFKTKYTQLSMDLKTINSQTRISSLDSYPLQYADAQIAARLRARGHTFWRCRKSAYVSYTGLDMEQDTKYVDTRFLIDVRTHWTMHGSRSITHFNTPPELYMNEERMACNEPPSGDDFVCVVPPSIYGFEMQEKKWVNLQVDNILSVEWNKDAFESLAIDKESKELIDALVNNKIAADKATDMVRGKGNGLIILLHGGPGTGKTLTAESVAEMAEKPLYRVTCGDIGTDPREVEKYLQKVFHLGKIWDCVVLLDEADVFLEQRTLADLSRNALVSVFLRTLEYYDGILILTSNRVGTFDEAFKSRIQLALHYEKLTLVQRTQIWQNFVRRLDSLDEDVDVESILDGVRKLARHEMNGRQIRNAITTARQLALFKKETLGMKHLEHSIQVSGKFDKYLDEVHDQIKDDEMARQEGIR